MIVDISVERPIVQKHIQQIAEMLCDFRPMEKSAWRSLAWASREVEESLKDDKARISIVALKDDVAVGWVAGFQTYPYAFELHPLVVRFDMQREGVGRVLVDCFEREARKHGALTVYLGADDEDGLTSVSGIELFPHVLQYAARLKNRRGHPCGFYKRCGYEIVGVFPDVNGKGKPDIWLAKSLKKR